MATINSSLTALANMMALINTQTVEGVTLTQAQVTFENMIEWTDPEGTNTRNTQVDVVGVDGAGRTGSYTIYYTRQDLEAYRFGQNLEVTLQSGDDLATVIGGLATTLGLIDSELELRDDLDQVMTELPMGITEATLVTLKAKDGSMLYIGDVSVTLQPVPSADEPMADAFASDQMDGFDEPVQ